MSWFKFDWFSSKERDEFNTLKQLNKLYTHEKLCLKPIEEQIAKPYKNLYFTGDIITIVLNDGTLISRKGDKDLFEKVKNSISEKEITNLLTERVNETHEDKLVFNNLSILEANPEFTIEKNKVYLKGVSLEIPVVIVASFIEICEKIDMYDIPSLTPSETFNNLQKEYQALKMFWMKLALNPIEQSREDLLRFVKENDVRITLNGNLALYRRINSKGNGSKKLIEFISQEYYRIKKTWKKSPKDFTIGKDSNGEFSTYLNSQSKDWETIGNLYNLYIELPNMEDNTYTAWHSGAGEIKIGAIYSIPETDINLNNGICSAGGLECGASL